MWVYGGTRERDSFLIGQLSEHGRLFWSTTGDVSERGLDATVKKQIELANRIRVAVTCQLSVRSFPRDSLIMRSYCIDASERGSQNVSGRRSSDPSGRLIVLGSGMENDHAQSPESLELLTPAGEGVREPDGVREPSDDLVQMGWVMLMKVCISSDREPVMILPVPSGSTLEHLEITKIQNHIWWL